MRRRSGARAGCPSRADARHGVAARGGHGGILREGERVGGRGYGTGVGQALGAADLLAKRGLDVTVADARSAKPMDAALLAQLAAEHDLVVTVEEGVLMGGFGTAVWESLSEPTQPAWPRGCSGSGSRTGT